MIGYLSFKQSSEVKSQGWKGISTITGDPGKLFVSPSSCRSKAMAQVPTVMPPFSLTESRKGQRKKEGEACPSSLLRFPESSHITSTYISWLELSSSYEPVWETRFLFQGALCPAKAGSSITMQETGNGYWDGQPGSSSMPPGRKTRF